MRTARSLAAATVFLVGFGLPALAQQAAPADDTDTDAPAAAEGKPAKPARKPAPKAAAPAKPAAPARTEAPLQPQTTPGGKPPVTAADVRPPPDMLLDCAKAPAGAVTKLQDVRLPAGRRSIARSSDTSSTPTTASSAPFRILACARRSAAADMMGKAGDAGNDAYFSSINYRQLSSAEVDALIALDPSVKKVLVDKPLWRLELTAAGGANLSFLAIDPTADFFWVFPLSQRGIDTPAFYVSSLAALNKAR